MNRTIASAVIILMFFSTWFNSALTYAEGHKTSDGYSKSVVAESRTICVPDNYRTIQEAINNASEGDTIFVRAGIYYEYVKIDKSLTLVGQNRSTTVIDGKGTGFVVYLTANNITLSGFTVQNGTLGIWLSHSNNNILTGNIASDNQYGIYSWSSGNNTLSGNIVSDNQYGIRFSRSRNNSFAGNIALNNEYGIYLDGSAHNTFTGNNVSSSGNSGIFLYHSGNNILSGNIVSDNQYGVYLSDSYDNIISNITASDNHYGIFLYYSRDNIVSGITALNNHCGIRLTSSSNNIIYNNNFIKNDEAASSIGSANSWDNGVEGNYWSDYDGDDANRDGIGDTPYPIYRNNQDNCPLMATFSQFTVMKKDQSHKINIVSSSTISNLQYCYDPDKRINAVSFEVNDAEGKGFCRINIAHALIRTPYTVTVDQNPPLYSGVVYENETHTWLCFTYNPLEREVTIVHTPYPEQLALSRWAILGLTIIMVILLSINIYYYRKLDRQKKVIEDYERELRSFPVSHSERARLLFIKDVIGRKEKIGDFRKKYGIKIEPADTLEDLMEKLGVKKKVNH